MKTNKQTIAGDIRRLRERLYVQTFQGNNNMVCCDYATMMKAFDSIESKEKRLQNENAELRECMKEVCKRLCDYCERQYECNGKCSTKDKQIKKWRAALEGGK